MANVFQPFYYEPLPADAVVVERDVRGRTIRVAEFVRRGKTVGGVVMADGKRVRRKSAAWWGRWTDGGKRQVRKLSTNKSAAMQMLGIILRQAEDRRAGILPSIDPFAVHRGRTTAEHLEDYQRSMLAGGCGDRHAGTTHFRCEQLLEGVDRLDGIAGSAVQARLQDLAAPTVDRPKGLGPTTQQGYLTAVKSFTAWLAGDKRLASDPLSGLDRLPSAEQLGDVRVMRRALSAEELVRLVAAAERAAGDFKGLDGPSRATLYVVAMGTGFRLGELASIAPAALGGTFKAPLLTVTAAYTKNGQLAEQPITPETAAAVRTHIKRLGLADGDQLWAGAWHWRAAEMLRADLAACRPPIAAETFEGVADFHALRHSYITALAADPRISVKVLQSLARHSTVQLTIGRYAKARTDDRAKALRALPKVKRSG